MTRRACQQTVKTNDGLKNTMAEAPKRLKGTPELVAALFKQAECAYIRA